MEVCVCVRVCGVGDMDVPKTDPDHLESAVGWLPWPELNEPLRDQRKQVVWSPSDGRYHLWRAPNTAAGVRFPGRQNDQDGANEEHLRPMHDSSIHVVWAKGTV